MRGPVSTPSHDRSGERVDSLREGVRGGSERHDRAERPAVLRQPSLSPLQAGRDASRPDENASTVHSTKIRTPSRRSAPRARSNSPSFRCSRFLHRKQVEGRREEHRKAEHERPLLARGRAPRPQRDAARLTGLVADRLRGVARASAPQPRREPEQHQPHDDLHPSAGRLAVIARRTGTLQERSATGPRPRPSAPRQRSRRAQAARTVAGQQKQQHQQRAGG